MQKNYKTQPVVLSIGEISEMLELISLISGTVGNTSDYIYELESQVSTSLNHIFQSSDLSKQAISKLIDLLSEYERQALVSCVNANPVEV